MARSGITQAQVDAAADALLLAGERPTIERVRAHLGTGAPATVIRLLDVWWKALGSRLQAQTVKVAMPEAPKEVAAAASQLWQLALSKAQELARHEQESAKAALDAARSELESERQSLLERAETSERLTAEADHRRTTAEVRLVDLQRLLDQQSFQMDTLVARSDGAEAEAHALRAKLDSALVALAESDKRAAAERSSLETAHRAAEDRWLQEVDRARQESERLKGKLRKLEKNGAAERADAAAKLAASARALQRAERDEAILTSRIGDLEAEIRRLHAQLEKAVQLRSTKGAVATKARNRKAPGRSRAPRSPSTE